MSGTPTLSMADVRAMIRDIRREMNEKLDLIEARLRRRSPSRRAKITSRRMTPALRAEIRAMAEKHPEMAMHEIAAALRVNVGRVSEVLAEAPAAPEVPQPSFHVVDEVAHVSRDVRDSLELAGFLPILEEGPPAPQTDALPGCATLRPVEKP